jgi:hypothetical protein
MKRPARRFVVRDPVYGVAVEFYVNAPQKTALRRCAAVVGMDANDPQNQPDGDAAAWAFSDRNWHCVWLSDYPADEGSLGHEICHVVCAALRHIETRDEETRAYLTGYITGEFRKKWLSK